MYIVLIFHYTVNLMLLHLTCLHQHVKVVIGIHEIHGHLDKTSSIDIEGKGCFSEGVKSYVHEAVVQECKASYLESGGLSL